MRSVVLGLGMSLDGHIARPDGSVDFLFMPKDYSMGPFFKTVDSAIMGRKTYEVGLRMSGGTFPAYGLTCYVFSRTLPRGQRPGVTIVNESPKSFVASLRQRKGKNIWHMGGGELAREFLKDDLIDQLYLGIVPTLIGGGIPLFPSGFPERHFHLVENKTYSQSMISLTYERVRSNPKAKSKARR